MVLQNLEIVEYDGIFCAIKYIKSVSNRMQSSKLTVADAAPLIRDVALPFYQETMSEFKYFLPVSQVKN